MNDPQTHQPIISEVSNGVISQYLKYVDSNCQFVTFPCTVWSADVNPVRNCDTKQPVNSTFNTSNYWDIHI